MRLDTNDTRAASARPFLSILRTSDRTIFAAIHPMTRMAIAATTFIPYCASKSCAFSRYFSMGHLSSTGSEFLPGGPELLGDWREASRSHGYGRRDAEVGIVPRIIALSFLRDPWLGAIPSLDFRPAGRGSWAAGAGPRGGPGRVVLARTVFLSPHHIPGVRQPLASSPAACTPRRFRPRSSPAGC